MNFEIEFLPVGNGDSSGDAIVIRYGENKIPLSFVVFIGVALLIVIGSLIRCSL